MLVENLRVYKKLCKLAIKVHNLTMTFPKYEMYELGSQLRRSSNSIPANLAEGFGNKHTNIYTESISRAQGELRETSHHLKMAFRKGYIAEEELRKLIKEYTKCSKMLYRLERSLVRRRR
jgi:four helix bundle protein